MKGPALLGRKQPRLDSCRGRKKADRGMVRQVSHSTAPPAPSHACAPSLTLVSQVHASPTENLTMLVACGSNLGISHRTYALNTLDALQYWQLSLDLFDV
jgi:hypothetical protein